MTVIYAFPPLKYTATLLDDELPSRSSRGVFSGQDYVSSSGPRRRVIRVTASSLSGNRDGAGMSASLNRLLDGGVNLVRMACPSINWCHEARPLASAPLTWTTEGDPLEWTDGGDPLLWFTGPALAATVTTLNGFAALALTGLTPGALVCRAYDVIRVYVEGEDGGASRAVKTVFADASGDAVIPLFDALPAGIVSVGDTETAVFRVTSRSPSDQPVSGNWMYSWALREVLPDEYPEDATEVDPWA
ncbi:hypothetical protein [Pararhodobacter zhoushanensis]|uniref:hypothetical protein n=1 Tax=Pararhodobacter zhoushanensis TaxID=2479545 RepID=UPI000F8F073E|nr:hypothetical protein [Pararhodobacter zhoushanensis]